VKEKKDKILSKTDSKELMSRKIYQKRTLIKSRDTKIMKKWRDMLKEESKENREQLLRKWHEEKRI